VKCGKAFRAFVGGILAGISIAIGGTVFLSLENKVLGALFFTVGLFAVCTFGFNLFTGKVCYMFDQDKAYALGLPLIWLGNLAGTFLTALAERATRVGPALAEKAQAICTVKLNDGLLSIFILSFFCNVLIWLAVEGFKNNPHPAGKYLSLFFGVAVFILCGFEHCVANMYYFSVAGMWSWKTLAWVLVMTLGNAAGGVFFPLMRRLLPQPAKKPGNVENTQKKQLFS
jgi:formate/nitrite transporter FocA (FNT family)